MPRSAHPELQRAPTPAPTPTPAPAPATHTLAARLPRAGKGVWGFTYDPLVGEFILSHPDIKIPEKGKIYSFNEGNYQVGGRAGGRAGRAAVVACVLARTARVYFLGCMCVFAEVIFSGYIRLALLRRVWLGGVAAFFPEHAVAAPAAKEGPLARTLCQPLLLPRFPGPLPCRPGPPSCSSTWTA